MPIWRKATDDTPKPYKVVPCKYTPDSADPRRDTELHWGFICADGTWSCGWENHQIEWLDESEPSFSIDDMESSFTYGFSSGCDGRDKRTLSKAYESFMKEQYNIDL